LPPKGKRKRKPPAEAPASLGPDVGNKYLCRQCGAIFRQYRYAEEHVNGKHGGGVIRLVIEQVEEGPVLLRLMGDPEDRYTDVPIAGAVIEVGQWIEAWHVTVTVGDDVYRIGPCATQGQAKGLANAIAIRANDQLSHPSSGSRQDG
jgi:hypothetical protein